MAKCVHGVTITKTITCESGCEAPATMTFPDLDRLVALAAQVIDADFYTPTHEREELVAGVEALVARVRAGEKTLMEMHGEHAALECDGVKAVQPIIDDLRQRAEQAEAALETMRAQLHGMQDGALLRDTQVALQQAEAERDTVRGKLDDERTRHLNAEVELHHERDHAQRELAVYKDWEKQLQKGFTTRQERWHPQYGPCDGFDEGDCSVCNEIMTNAQREVGRLREALDGCARAKSLTTAQHVAAAALAPDPAENTAANLRRDAEGKGCTKLVPLTYSDGEYTRELAECGNPKPCRDHDAEGEK